MTTERLPGDVSGEVLGENKWVRLGLCGTSDVRLVIDRPVRVKACIRHDGMLAVLVFEGLEPVADEKPIATFGRSPHPDANWISRQGQELITMPRAST